MVPDQISSNILLCFEDRGRPIWAVVDWEFVHIVWPWPLGLDDGTCGGPWPLVLGPFHVAPGPLPLVQWAAGPANGPEPLSLASKGLLAFVGPPLRTCEAPNLRPKGPKSKFGLICWEARPKNRPQAQKWTQI